MAAFEALTQALRDWCAGVDATAAQQAAELRAVLAEQEAVASSLLLGTLHATQWAAVTDTATLPGVNNAIATGAWGRVDEADLTSDWLDTVCPAPTDDHLARIWAD